MDRELREVQYQEDCGTSRRAGEAQQEIQQQEDHVGHRKESPDISGNRQDQPQAHCDGTAPPEATGQWSNEAERAHRWLEEVDQEGRSDRPYQMPDVKWGVLN